MSKNIATLKSRSIKVIENGTIRYTGYGFLLVSCNNFVPKTHRFSDIRLETCRHLDRFSRLDTLPAYDGQTDGQRTTKKNRAM